MHSHTNDIREEDLFAISLRELYQVIQCCFCCTLLLLRLNPVVVRVLLLPRGLEKSPPFQFHAVVRCVALGRLWSSSSSCCCYVWTYGEVNSHGLAAALLATAAELNTKPIVQQCVCVCGHSHGRHDYDNRATSSAVFKAKWDVSVCSC